MKKTSSLIALVGNPNTGKTALFNALTGSRQKVANYPGVTVERKEGPITTSEGSVFSLLDLPGCYSLDAKTPDERVTRDVVLGRQAGEALPQALICVVDATSLKRGLAFVLEVKERCIPFVLALNMVDLAAKAGLSIDQDALSKELGAPVVATVAVKNYGTQELIDVVSSLVQKTGEPLETPWVSPTPAQVKDRFFEVDRILKHCTHDSGMVQKKASRLDRLVLHPVWGNLFLLGLLLLMFQAIFSWAELPMNGIDLLMAWMGETVSQALPEGLLQSLLVDGVIAGVGSVLIFLPQILILFFFILIMEDSGYMARAAFLMDYLMSKVGLHGRAFLPLISGHACAIPGIMAARTIENPKDRLATILMVPLTTCSARLPVYTLLISAFIPDKSFFGFLNLQGLVMLGLYLVGILSALGMGFIFKKTLLQGPASSLLLELPTYKWPSWRNLVLGLFERAKIFVKRAGTLILALSILLWVTSTFPKPPSGATEPAIHYSFAGQLGHWIEPVIKPLGFDWRIGTGFVPGFAAREVMVSALATVYALDDTGDEQAQEILLSQRLAGEWSLATALSLMMWYVFAPQCLATLAVVKRETNSWRWPLFLMGYMLALAYIASLITYQVVSRIL